MRIFERIVMLILKGKTQELIDKVKSDPEMVKAIKEFEKAKSDLQKSTKRLEDAHKLPVK